jgi:hypothetical protein
MQGRKKLSRLNRLAALVLAVVWLGAGIAALAAGFLRSQWLLLPVGLFAVVYGALWLRVVARSRLLSWHELVAPWRAGTASRRSAKRAHRLDRDASR